MSSRDRSLKGIFYRVNLMYYVDCDIMAMKIRFSECRVRETQSFKHMLVSFGDIYPSIVKQYCMIGCLTVNILVIHWSETSRKLCYWLATILLWEQKTIRERERRIAIINNEQYSHWKLSLYKVDRRSFCKLVFSDCVRGVRTDYLIRYTYAILFVNGSSVQVIDSLFTGAQLNDSLF